MAPQNWEVLRRSLRRCHDVIDQHLTELHEVQRLADSNTSYRRDTFGSVIESDVDHLISKCETLSQSIRSNLRQANDYIDKMANHTDGDSVAMVQLQRLQGITSSYNKEFDQTFNLTMSSLDRKRFLSKMNASSSSSFNPTVQDHLREQRKIYSSLSILDHSIDMGRNVLGRLNSQRHRMLSSRDMLQKMNNQIPRVKNIIFKIKRVGCRRSVILAILSGIFILVAFYALIPKHKS